MKRGASTDAVAAVLLCAFAVLLWLPALWTPFWGDDYFYLQGARAANEAGQPWLQTFWPEHPMKFWRPLSQEAFWRVVESALGADALLAHGVNLVLHLSAAACVGVFGHALARACAWEQPRAVALLSFSFYVVLALGMLPVHWVAAANSPILVALTALILAAWLSAAHASGVLRIALLAAMPVLLAAALLSKESAVLTPLLMLASSLFAGTRPRRGEVAAWLACLVVALAWLALRQQVTENDAAQYGFVFGTGMLRNAASLGAWLLNVPREALRMIATGELLPGAAWAVAVALPVAAAWLLALRGGVGRLDARQWGVLPLFVGLAYAPYFPLAWNSYAYYAAVAAILPTVALARCLQGRGVAVVAAALVGASSLVAVEGTRRLDHPGLIGRAHWAEATLRELERSPPGAPLSVEVEDEQRFYAIGANGLAWRLGLKPEDVRIVAACPVDGACLQIRADGSWQLH